MPYRRKFCSAILIYYFHLYIEYGTYSISITIFAVCCRKTSSNYWTGSCIRSSNPTKQFAENAVTRSSQSMIRQLVIKYRTVALPRELVFFLPWYTPPPLGVFSRQPHPRLFYLIEVGAGPLFS